MIQSLSLCAEMVLDLHNLNSEGTEGNQQQTRMVHVVDKYGKRHQVNAVSGDMFKHIFVGHLTPLLETANQKISEGASRHDPDRITQDDGFRKEYSGSRRNVSILDAMIQLCAVTDIAGALFTEGGASAPRKSCVEFGWVVGVPLKNYTEQYFHVKFDPEGREKSAGQEPRGQGSQVDRQPIFYRPANSGVYALICHMELSRVGVNDITRKAVISNADRQARCRAAIHALLATLVKPSGAQRNTQNPHILDCRGVVATSISYLPAPTVSPLAEDYRQQMKDIAGTLNRISPAAVTVRAFDSLPGGVAVLEEIASGV